MMMDASFLPCGFGKSRRELIRDCLPHGPEASLTGIDISEWRWLRHGGIDVELNRTIASLPRSARCL
jgi:hypothetical protein